MMYLDFAALALAMLLFAEAIRRELRKLKDGQLNLHTKLDTLGADLVEAEELRDTDLQDAMTLEFDAVRSELTAIKGSLPRKRNRKAKGEAAGGVAS